MTKTTMTTGNTQDCDALSPADASDELNKKENSIFIYHAIAIYMPVINMLLKCCTCYI